jgi:hypothetical protein
MTMTMTVETPPPDRIRPAAVAGLPLGDLIAPAAIHYAARALASPVVPVIAVPVLLGGTALYCQRTGLGIHRSLEAMSRQATGGAR